MNADRLLLVEDNPQDSKLALRALKSVNLDTAIDVVRDGIEALDYLFCENTYTDREPPLLPVAVLLDIGLPKLSGLEVLERMRGDARTRHVPIVMLTSSDDRNDVAESYRLGANSYIRKPMDTAGFNRTVAQLGLYWLKINEPPYPE